MLGVYCDTCQKEYEVFAVDSWCSHLRTKRWTVIWDNWNHEDDPAYWLSHVPTLMLLNEKAEEKRMSRQIIQEITHENIDFVLTYRAPQTDAEKARYAKVNEACKAAIRAILAAVPRCPQRTAAINKIVEARFWCNAAINFDVSLNPGDPGMLEAGAPQSVGNVQPNKEDNS